MSLQRCPGSPWQRQAARPLACRSDRQRRYRLQEPKTEPVRDRTKEWRCSCWTQCWTQMLPRVLKEFSLKHAFTSGALTFLKLRTTRSRYRENTRQKPHKPVQCCTASARGVQEKGCGTQHEFYWASCTNQNTRIHRKVI